MRAGQDRRTRRVRTMPQQINFDITIDYYKVLELTDKASSDEIKKAHRRLAKQYHPDSTGDTTTNSVRFKEIQSAYDVLGDPNNKEIYDRVRSGGSHHPASAGFDPGNIFGEFFAEMAKGNKKVREEPPGFEKSSSSLDDMYRLAKGLRRKGCSQTAKIIQGGQDLDYIVKVAVSSAFCLLADEMDKVFNFNTELTVEEMSTS